MKSRSNYYGQLKRLSNFLEILTYPPFWATTARNKNVPLSIISAGMGQDDTDLLTKMRKFSYRRSK